MSVVPFLRALGEVGGSDLHFKVGSPPRVRIDGRLRKLQAPNLTPTDTEHMVSEVLRDDLVEEFAQTNEADFAYSVPGLGRFRVNAFRSRGSAGMVFRRVSVGAIPLDDLGLPPVLSALAMEPRGLVLVTGPTGSGKTTTLAGMIDHINNNREVHIVTIEDPIEVLHFDKLSMINQREVRLDTADFATALRGAMRQDPDVILVGEMRDHETVKAALAASETGHFVMSTLHTTDAQETITRVIDFFPPHEQKQVRLALAGALRGIICQRLVPARRRPGPLRGDGDLRGHRPHRRRHRRPRQDRHHRRADQGGCVLRHADLRPAPGRPDPRRRHHPRGRDGAPRPARTTSPSSCAASASSPDRAS